MSITRYYGIVIIISILSSSTIKAALWAYRIIDGSAKHKFV
jgi:hypothetical protein